LLNGGLPSSGERFNEHVGMAMAGVTQDLESDKLKQFREE
jgi:hypothetical protein